jgi:hypothetical protein
MHVRKIVLPLFALALGLNFAAAAADAPAAEAPKTAAKSCCKHSDAADGKSGMACDHAKMKAHGEAGKACCTQHAASLEEGAAGEAKACCAHHAAKMKDGGDATTACAEHAAGMKDGDKAGCCCKDGAACPHSAAGNAPAKS